MRGKENGLILAMAIAPRCLRNRGLLLFGLVVGVGILASLFVSLLGDGTGTTQAAPPSLSHLVLLNTPQESCDEPGNLVPNPGLECAGAFPSEPADWMSDAYEGPPAVLFRSRQFRHSGGYSVFIGSGSRGSNSRWRSKPIPAYEGRIYEFSVWVNADELSNKATISLTFWSGWPAESNVLGWASAEGTGNTSGEWVQLVGSHVAPTGTRYIRLECRLYGAGTVWFDDALIREYVEEPVLDLAQFDIPDPVRPEDLLVYTLTYSNTGNSTASSVVITNTFDTNVQFTGDANPPPTSGSGRVWSWRLGSLPVDGLHQIVITATVKPSVADGIVLLNRVNWRSDQISARWDLEETLVRNVPILTIDKIDTSDPLTAGERLTYTITYTNSGTASMTGVFLMESYPLSTVFITATPAPANPPTNTFWQMPDLLPGGTKSVTVVVSTSVSAAGMAFNNVLLDSDETGPVIVHESTVVSGLPQPGFLMNLSPQRLDLPVEAGKTVTIDYQLVNVGTQALTDITMTTSTPQDWKGSVQIEPAYISSLSSGGYQLLTLTVRPAIDEISGTYLAQVTATSNETSAQAVAIVKVPRYWGVAVEPDNMHIVRPCDQVTFTHWVTNLGNFDDTIVVNVSPFTSWPISPTSIVIVDAGVRKAYMFMIAVGVPCGMQRGDVGGAKVQVASATGTAADSALDFYVVVPSVREVFLPVVMKRLGESPCDVGLCNGDFKEPLEPCWNSISPPIERICSSPGTDCYVRLGTEADDEKCDGSIVPHTTELVQTFAPTVTGVLTLSFEYKVHTLDVLMPPYDTMKVYIGATPVLTVVHGHVPYGCGAPPLIVSGTAEIPFFVTHGVPTTLKFILINDSWFNTYADIDNVRIACAR